MSTESLSSAPSDREYASLTPESTSLRTRGGSALIIDFSRGGNSGIYRTFGWSQQEETHVWSLGRRSGMRLPPPAEHTPLILEIGFDVCRAGDVVTTAALRVIVNQEVVSVARANGRSRLRCAIPIGLMQPNVPIDVRFEHECFVRLDFAGLGTDDRILGLCFFSVSLYPPWIQDIAFTFSPFATGEKLLESRDMHTTSVHREQSDRAIYRFGGAQIGPALGEGWRRDEGGNMWADARLSHLTVPAPYTAGRYLLRIDIAPLHIRMSLDRQRITVVLNGAVIGQFETGTETSLSMPLPEELVDVGGALQLNFISPDGLPVHEIDSKVDHQWLSFILDSIVIEPIPLKLSDIACWRDDDVEPLQPIAISDESPDDNVFGLDRVLSHELHSRLEDLLGPFDILSESRALDIATGKVDDKLYGFLTLSDWPLRQSELTPAPTAVDDPPVRDLEQGDAELLKIVTVFRADSRKHKIPIQRFDEREHGEEPSEPLRTAEVIWLYLLTNTHTANWLLYIVPCSGNRRGGAVELIMPGIMRGYVRNVSALIVADGQDRSELTRLANNALLLAQRPNIEVGDAEVDEPRGAAP